MDQFNGNREFDSEERYEREKLTRIMPPDLKPLGLYILRMKFPPGSDPFGAEYLTAIVGVDAADDGYYVAYCWSTARHGGEPTREDVFFNANGFLVIDNVGPDRIPGLPAEVEIGYFLGSEDPLDVEAAALVENTRELVA